MRITRLERPFFRHPGRGQSPRAGIQNRRANFSCRDSRSRIASLCSASGMTMRRASPLAGMTGWIGCISLVDEKLVAVERLGADAALGVAGDFFHPHLGVGKQRLAALLQRLAALVNLDRFIERDIALLE